MKNLSRVAIIAIAIVLAICVAGIGTWIHACHTQSAKLTPSSPFPTAQATINKPAPLPASTVKSTEPSASQMQLAIAHKGEGVESTFIRQFAADPVAYGFNGKQDDAKAIHRWAGRQAHLLAIKAGYYDWKFGAEVGAASPDKMAFGIQKNAGGLTVVEYAVTGPTATPTFSQGATHIASATVGTSNFFGASPITGEKLPVPHGEYVHFPGE
jgi:hypothetical protein